MEDWLNRTQAGLAHRSRSGETFTRLYDLFRNRRLVEIALAKVLQNEGAKTAGVDGITKADLKEGGDRARFIDEVGTALRRKTYQPSSVRRVYIPKPNGDRRPLGIPTLRDRVVQEMLRLVLEPIYEQKFYRYSFGFRPFRSTHHAAVELHWLIVRHQYNWVIEGDIRKCFDRICHTKMLTILRKTIQDESVIRLVKQMLQAGVMDDGVWHVTDEGTPQGGIVSPLLANVYLNELDQFVAEMWDRKLSKDKQRARKYLKKEDNYSLTETAIPCYLVRYADDFVIALRGSQAVAEQIKQRVAKFLDAELSLELSAEKTLVTSVDKGFDFLGFHIRKYTHTTLITPSRKAVARFRIEVKERFQTGLAQGDVAAIVQLNQYIRGWGEYYRRVSSGHTFNALEHYVWWTVWRRAERQHNVSNHNGGKRKHYAKYLIPYRFDIVRQNRWSSRKHFGVWADEKHTVAYIVTGLSLLHIKYVHHHPQLNPYDPAERAILEQEATCPDWAKTKPPTLPTGEYGPEWKYVRREKLNRSQWTCEMCGNPIDGQRAQVHHQTKLRLSPSRRNANRLENLSALCSKCHRRSDRETETGEATSESA